MKHLDGDAETPVGVARKTTEMKFQLKTMRKNQVFVDKKPPHNPGNYSGTSSILLPTGQKNLAVLTGWPY